MEEKKPNRIEYTKTQIERYDEAIIHAKDQLSTRESLLAKIPQLDPSQFAEFYSKYKEALLKKQNKLEVDSSTRVNIENLTENEAKQPFLRNQSPHEDNVEKNKSPKSVVRLSNTNTTKDNGKLNQKKSDHGTIFTRTQEVLDFQNMVYESVQENNEQTRSSVIIKELIETEKEYIKNLDLIMLYKDAFERILPTDIKSQVIEDLFCNIEDIYENQKKFLIRLKRSKNETDVNAAFILMESIFEHYIFYARNKKKSNKTYKIYYEIVKNIQQYINDSSDLSEYLSRPIQRLCHYVLFLGEIEKDLTERKLDSQHIYSSKIKIQKVIRRINDLLSIDSIKNLPSNLNLNDEGNYILRESFKLSKPFTLDIIAFLFQNVLVITVPDKNKTTQFLYIKHLHLNTIKLVAREEDTFTFTLEKCDAREYLDKSMNIYEFKTEKPVLKQHWEEILRKVLWEQFSEMKRQATTAHIAYSDEAVDYIQGNRPLNELI